jgi:hypothetical protein
MLKPFKHFGRNENFAIGKMNFAVVAAGFNTNNVVDFNDVGSRCISEEEQVGNVLHLLLGVYFNCKIVCVITDCNYMMM